MEITRQRADARAGLVGNPSDGYHGRTISFAIRDFWADVVLYEWEDVEIIPSLDDRRRFSSIGELVQNVERQGFYGGTRLVKATIKKFYEYCRDRHQLHDRNFSIRYESNIPRAVGLAGSSAIIVATLRSLMDYYGVTIPREVQPSLALSVETEELKIAAGLQDRVIQVYGGLVFMDFGHDKMTVRDGLECGDYESLDPQLLRNVYLAYSVDVGEPTEVFHNNLRHRFDSGDAAVVEGIAHFAQLASDARVALEQGDLERLSRILDENFDTRARLCRLSPRHIEMVQAARSAGASAKFAGSGGAIVGVYPDLNCYDRLQDRLGKMGCAVLQPTVADAVE